jgi:hypothetical protein
VITRNFGFGCFAFTAPSADNLTGDNPKGEYRIMDWASDVKTALETLPSIDKVEFVEEPTSTLGTPARDLLTRWGIEDDVLARKPHHYGSFVPHPSSGCLNFEVRIPAPVRERLFFWQKLHSDIFYVRMFFQHSVPVCVITGNDPRDGSGSTVPVVREFLKEEFTRRAEQLNGIEFEYLPPAPMHLQGILQERENDDQSEPTVAIVPSRGYDRLEATVAKGETDTRFEELIWSLVPEVAMYFSLVGTSNYLRDTEKVLEAYSAQLVNEYRATGVKAYGRRVFGGYRAAANLQIMAVEAEQARKEMVTGAIAARDEQKRLAGHLVTQAWIDDEISSLQRTAAPDIGKICGYISAGTAHSVQSLAVVGSAVMGGAAGAALTALLT